MMELWTSPEAWAALLTLTALEIVLGIDNVIFLSIIVSRIPDEQAKRARQIGLALALAISDSVAEHAGMADWTDAKTLSP